MPYDYIVIGGGTAGAVVAARLSEERDLRVLLLEAGPDYPGGPPGELLDASGPVTSGHNWELQAVAGEDGAVASREQRQRVARVFELAAGRLPSGAGLPRLHAAGEGAAAGFPYPMGKVMGGGSAINGGLALHARPEDFAVWAGLGNDRWSWEEVRPAIDRLERAEPDKPALPLETAPPGGLTDCQGAFLASCLELGNARVDLRQGADAGVGVVPKSCRQGQRVSTASLYLAAARRRPNLTIRSGCLVDRLLCERRQGAVAASGVEAVVDGRRERFAAGQIVLAAGAVHSPAILLRSGIGAAADVARLGGEPLLDLPGVGRDLVDHPAVVIWAVPRPGTWIAGEPTHQVMVQRRSTASAPLCDLQVFMLSALATAKLPPLREVVRSDVAIGLSAVVATPVSRGRVEILDRDPERPPRICLNCVREASDLRRMMAALRTAWRLLQGGHLASRVERVVLWDQGIVESDALMEKLVRTTVRGAWHPAGSLRMGRHADEGAVVDQDGRLHGTVNVTVADASIMPALPSVPTNLTCMLIGERIAAALRGRDGGRRAADRV